MKYVLLWWLKEPENEVGPGKQKEVVDKAMNDLLMKPSDAVDRRKWKEKWLEVIGVTAIMMVMLWAEYKLRIFGAGSPRLT